MLKLALSQLSGFARIAKGENRKLLAPMTWFCAGFMDDTIDVAEKSGCNLLFFSRLKLQPK